MDMWFVLDTPSDLKKSSTPPSGVKATRKSEQEQPSEVEEEIIEVTYVSYFQQLPSLAIGGDLCASGYDETTRHVHYTQINIIVFRVAEVRAGTAFRGRRRNH